MRNNYICETSAEAEVMRSPSCSVRGALELTLRISRSLGIAPVTFASEKERGCVMRLATEPNYYGYMLISVIHVCLLSGFIMELNATDKRSGRLGSSFECAKWVLELCFLGFIATVGVIGARSRMETVIACLSTIEKINGQENKKADGLSVEEKKKLIVFLIGTLSVVFEMAGYHMLGVVSASESEEVQNLYKRVSYLFTVVVVEMWMVVVLEMQFLFVALDVNSALTALNDSVHTLLYIIDMQSSTSLPVLKTGLPDSKFIPVSHINAAIDSLNEKTTAKDKDYVSSDVSRMVSRLIISYGQVGEVIQKVNASYELLLLALFGSFLFYLVITPHSMIICIYEGASKTMIVLAMFSIAIHAVHLIMGAEPGSKIEVEMQRTKLLVSQLSSRGPQSEQAISFQLHLLYKHVQLNQSCCTPMGVFLLNRPLVIEIFGVASTFLTIILQYRVLDRDS